MLERKKEVLQCGLCSRICQKFSGFAENSTESQKVTTTRIILFWFVCFVVFSFKLFGSQRIDGCIVPLSSRREHSFLGPAAWL